MHTIFVGGVHGVGKSTCCEQAARALGIQHRSASAMIKSQQAEAISTTSKAVVSPAANQRLLIQAVTTFFTTGEKMLLLDGHFTIPTTAGQVERIPVEVFKALIVSGIVVLVEKPHVIRNHRKGRDGTAPDVTAIEVAQSMELVHARTIARALACPFASFAPNDRTAFVAAIQQLLLEIARGNPA